MELLNHLLALPLFRNSFADWLLAVTLMVVIFIALLIARRLVRRYHERLLKTERTEFAEIPVEVLSATTVAFFLVLSVFTGLGALSMSPSTARVLNWNGKRRTKPPSVLG